LKEGLVVEGNPTGRKEMGRRPRKLCLNTQTTFFISIDIGREKITSGLGNLAGELLHESQVRDPRHWDKIVTAIGREYEKCRKIWNVSSEQIKGIAIGAPGVVDIERGTVTSSPNIGGPNEYPLRDRLRKHISAPIWIENDVNLAAMGEFWKQKESFDDIVYISMGTLIGGALIINGNLFRGKRYYAGEVGWFIPGKEYLSTNIGKFGCLEALASGPALSRRAEQVFLRLSNRQNPKSLGRKITPEMIFGAYGKGVSWAQKIVDDWIKNIGIALCNISSLMNPEIIIIGGGLSFSAPLYLKKLEELMARGTQCPPRIRVSDLKEKAPLYGGLKLCLDRHLEGLYVS
jgi:glucokinase